MLRFEAGAQELLTKAKENFKESADRAGEKLFSGTAAMTGFVTLPETMTDELICRIEAAADEIRAVCDTLVVVGIGGSYLGVSACDRMLKKDGQSLELLYAGYSLSASHHRRLIEKLDKCEPAICVISKSGSTMESSMAFSLLRDYVEKRFGKKSAERFIVIAGEQDNPLKTEAMERGYRLFSLPENVGGRYSILSAAGLVPLAMAGYDIRAMLKGARELKSRLEAVPFSETPCGEYAMIRNHLYNEGKRVEVFSLTEDEMHEMGQWLAQLFGESEGKCGHGFFPACVHYSTDLHAVGQFLEEGSRVFLETLLTVDERSEDISAPGFCYSYNDSIAAAAEAVWHVRKAKNTPIVRVTIGSLCEECIGELLYFFEMACAAGCYMMGVNPFDQPGVEAYKKEIRALLCK